MIAMFAAVSLFAAEGVFAQRCDKVKEGPIKCGYYEEGYIDGANDARNNLENDYRRYRSKFEDQYESHYRTGYDDGYASVRPFARWTDEQKNVYDQGFDDGEDDKRRNISRLPARYEGQYDRSFEAYYRRGYLDGYDGRQKNYDVPIGRPVSRRDTRPGFPGRPGRRIGTTRGTGTWRGRVDNRVNIVIQGSEMRTQTVAGDVSGVVQNLQGVLPRRNATVSVRKLDGRGSAFVLQQPTRTNNYTAIVQVYDPRRGRDNYNLQISWTSTNTVEPYSSGKVRWKGRVNQLVTLRIYGDTVEAVDETASGLSEVTYDFEGYLAARPGSVRINKRDGRGTVRIVEQPSARNDYTAVIQITDTRGGDDEYDIEIEW